MENENLKDIQFLNANSEATEQESKLQNIPIKEAESSIEEYQKDNKLKKLPCFFIPLDVIEKFYGIPNIQGITIYIGKIQGQEVLYLVGTTKIGNQYYDVYNYNFSINDGQVSEPKYIKVPTYAGHLCPPPSCTIAFLMKEK